MSISKRLRFEIFRRDGWRCRYCGTPAAETAEGLTVDHVVPVALGGSDEPSNLVTACRACNSGKSATPADAAVVAEVSDDAIRWSHAMQEAYAQELNDMAVKQEYVDQFDAEWFKWGSGFNLKNKVPRPGDWEGSVGRWYGAGIPIEILKDAITIAMTARSIRKNTDYPEFSYMAGVVWGKHREMQERVAAQLTSPPPPPITSVGQFDLEKFEGWNALYATVSYEMYVARLLRQVCDDGGIQAVSDAA